MNPGSLPPSIRSEFADDEEFHDLLTAFAGTIAEAKSTLRALCDRGAIDELRVSAHQLKGAGAGYGFPGLTAVAGRLEHACSPTPQESPEAALDRLLDYFDRIEI